MLNETALQPTRGHMLFCEEAIMQRASLVHWVMQVCESFSMAHVSHGCVLNYLERTIERTKFSEVAPLVGAAAVLIGSKFCETDPVCLEQLQRCVPNFNRAQICQMEENMLCVLNWQLHVVTTHHFADVLLQLIPDHPEAVKLKVRKHIELLVDLTMLDPAFIGHKRSMIAVAAMVTALELCNLPLPEIVPYCTLVGDTVGSQEHLTRSTTRLKRAFNRGFSRAGVSLSGRLSPQNVVQAAKPEAGFGGSSEAGFSL